MKMSEAKHIEWQRNNMWHVQIAFDKHILLKWKTMGKLLHLIDTMDAKHQQGRIKTETSRNEVIHTHAFMKLYVNTSVNTCLADTQRSRHYFYHISSPHLEWCLCDCTRWCEANICKRFDEQLNELRWKYSFYGIFLFEPIIDQ